jgi:hypothetical protein
MAWLMYALMKSLAKTIKLPPTARMIHPEHSNSTTMRSRLRPTSSASESSGDAKLN